MLITNQRRPRTIWSELEAGLGTGPRFRVLLHLALHPEDAFTKYALVKATGLRTPAVTEQLGRLVELGWARKYESSPVTHQICLNNEVAKLIHKLFSNLKGVKA
jgi:DNA-binding MarR family transcriptional regulator